MKIFLPVDGSEHTKRMLSYIAAHDELLRDKHQYIVFTAVPAVPPRAASFLDGHTLAQYYEEQADEVLRPIRRFAEQHRWDAVCLHAHGPVVDAIAAAVRDTKPDLIVMGTHGHSALANVLLGSVATGVIARCDLPVLLVP
jgi:nucleotide-binding universal stress UspA family protein